MNNKYPYFKNGDSTLISSIKLFYKVGKYGLDDRQTSSPTPES